VIDDVRVAVALVDSFTGLMVTGRVKVTLLDNVSFRALPDRLLRNRSGMWVLTRRVAPGTPFAAADGAGAPEQYTFEVLATAAGYFDRERLVFLPDPARPLERRFDVVLHRRPSAPLEPGVTTVVGTVKKNGQPAPGAVIRATFSGDSLPPGATELRRFESQSDERGAFVLRLRLPLNTESGPTRVRFQFVLGVVSRSAELAVHAGQLNAFEKSIEF
jgi:hypothetical protein